MRWLPSTKWRYLAFATTVLATLGLLDHVVGWFAHRHDIGFALTLLACFGVVYAWLRLEPVINDALLVDKISSGAMVDRVYGQIELVACAAGMNAPRLCLYEDGQFGVMVAGIGAGATLFMSKRTADLGDIELRAIIGHELGHLKLGHELTRLWLYGSLLSLAMVSNGTPMVTMLANLFILWVRRQMEFAADAVAAGTVGRAGVYQALLAIDGGHRPTPAWHAFFSTHPSLSARLERLSCTGFVDGVA